MSGKLDNVQTILDFLMKNAEELSAEKIQAFSSVLEAVRDYQHSDPTPNEGVEIGDDMPIMEETPINMQDIAGFTINGGKKVEIKK